MTNQIIHGDCIEKLKELPENSIDSIVTDPPYHLVSIVKRFGKESSAPAQHGKDGSFARLSGGFMGKTWDGLGEDGIGIANNPLMWAECLRVLKPGGYLLSFGGTRTYHRMASAIEDAGFEVRDMIEWVYGSGFPKSRNIGLDVDKRNGVTKNRGKAFVVAGQSGQRDKDTGGDLVPGSNTMGAYIAQNEWSGWGTALKPAHEPICMARKPLAEKTVAENVLKYGTGGINIDESRVAANWKDERPDSWFNSGKSKSGKPTYEGNLKSLTESTVGDRLHDSGRFPANLIHDNSEEVRECFPETKSGAVKNTTNNFNGSNNVNIGGGMLSPENSYGDSGNASRFFKSINNIVKTSNSTEQDKFWYEYKKVSEQLVPKSIIYQAKASKSERGKNNYHPTVKPIALMEYLIKMVTPKGGIVLDPFAGSGSTLVAAKQNGYQYIGIEMTEEYIPIIKARLNND